MSARYTQQDVRLTYKPRDAWWTVLLVDPLAGPLTRVVANRTSISPNQLTLAAAFVGLTAAWSFWIATPIALVLGALLFHLSFVIDCMDGKVARLKGTGSPFGVWLDFLFDRVRDVVCTIALFGGQYRETGENWYLYTAFAFLAVNMFRYLDSSQVAKVRKAMNTAIIDACLAQGVDPARFVLGRSEDDDAGDDLALAKTDHPDAPVIPVADPVTAALNSRATAKGSTYARVRDALLRRRIRIHLFSGIELQMTTFVVGSAVQAFWVGGLLVISWTAMALMLAFEALLVAKLWAATRHYARIMERIAQLGAGGPNGPSD